MQTREKSETETRIIAEYAIASSWDMPTSEKRKTSTKSLVPIPETVIGTRLTKIIKVIAKIKKNSSI